MSYRETLKHFIMRQQTQITGATGEFTLLLDDVSSACKGVANLVRRGDLSGELGAAVGVNVQDENQKKLDVMANELALSWCEKGGQLFAMASEEMVDVYPVPKGFQRGKYLLIFDPLDGSSNIEVNGPMGTIFSILEMPEDGNGDLAENFLQQGTRQLCAGYVLFGPATMMVLTTGNGVNGFTLNPDIGEFVLTHPDITIPEDTQEFAINASNRRHWEPPVRRYIDECLDGKTGPRGKDFNMRWVAAMVADVHRILTRGGIFMYPIDEKIRDKGGRLRLLYEANPMSFIIEQAGGMASTGRGRILDVQPTGLHQRVPVIIGAKNEVQRIVDYHTEFDAGES
ncbi:MAG: class 1 fructose-bisphosphatase [Rhodospirillales bacterium]|nr:class 1 fructose-bisphosphatase [Rhodospirillales bacterium]MBO6786589.1 class 1 fructose-bisphosphatase [Rhodospirillales bacterium]